MLFGCNPQIIFCHFFSHILALYSLYIVGLFVRATPPTVHYKSI